MLDRFKVPLEDQVRVPQDALRGTVAAIFEIKKRPRFNPLILHLADPALAKGLVRFDARAELLAAHFWPGPLSLVLPRRADGAASLLCSAGLDCLAVRVPSHPVARGLLERIGQAVAQILQPDTRSICCQNRGFLHARFELLIQCSLCIRVFENSFDDDICLWDTLAVHIRHQSIHGRPDQSWLVQFLRKQLVSALDCRGDIFWLAILQGYVKPAQCAPGGNVATHDACTDYMDVTESRLQRRVPRD